MERPTPTELAAKADISVSYASEILSGARRPSASLAKRLEQVAGIPKHELRPDVFDAPEAA
jgi:transcriptional regulator with XRE-family HTH domain